LDRSQVFVRLLPSLLGAALPTGIVTNSKLVAALDLGDVAGSLDRIVR
jgi:hypothetical protein